MKRLALVLVLVLAASGLVASAQTPSPTAAPTPTPDPVAAAVVQADAKLLGYKTSEARTALDAVAGQAATDARVALALGRVLEQEKRYAEAVTQLRKAAELAGSDPAAYVYLGDAYVRLKKQADADAAFRKAVEVAQAAATAAPDNASAAYWLGVAQQRARQFDAAAINLEKSRTLQPGGAVTLLQLGMTRAYQQKWAEAVDLLTRAIETDSGLAYAYYYRGIAQEKLGRKDQLVLDMDRFLKLAPNAPEAERAAAVVKAARR